MKSHRMIAIAAAAGLCLSAHAAPPARNSALKQFSTDLADMVEQVMPSVVVIRTEAVQYLRGFDWFYGRQVIVPRRSEGQGSGFVFDERGYVLTSNHVIHGAKQIEVIFPDEAAFKAELVGSDENTDLAVLKIQKLGGRKLKAIPLGDSERLRVGEIVVAIGSPFSLSSSVTMGVVSQKGRTVTDLPMADFIQTDAPINPGNSGGPLVDLDGRVVGMNAVIQTGGGGGNIGIGFAVPSNLIRRVADSIIRTGKFDRPWIGIRPGPHPHPQGGVMVETVFEDTPAARAGVREGDVLTHARGQELHNVTDLLRAVYSAPEGQAIPFSVRRGRKTLELSFPAMAMPSDGGAP